LLVLRTGILEKPRAGLVPRATMPRPTIGSAMTT
jgi:hypothetical protein